jgi:hypothetical protein
VIVKFITEVIKQLEGQANRLVREDLMLAYMLYIEFASHPRGVQSSVELCNLMCDFFAPLLTQTGKDLPAKLLQLEYKDILTQQLQTYEDKHTKVCNKYLFNKFWANFILKKR